MVVTLHRGLQSEIQNLQAKTIRIGGTKYNRKRFIGKDKKVGGVFRWNGMGRKMRLGSEPEAGIDRHRNLMSSRKSASLSLGPPITGSIPTFRCYTV